MKLDLLAIAAHPDDVELTCGGTLIKMAQQGYKTGILDLTRGEMGTRGTPEIRAREAAAAARVMRVAWRGNLGVPDSDVQPTRKNKLALAAMVRRLRPRTVILPYWKGRHPDHYHGSTLGYEGCFLAGLQALALDGEPFRPHKILYALAYTDHVKPSFAVDITDQFALRNKAILCYRSQFRPRSMARNSRVHLPLDRLQQEMDLHARACGRLIGVTYAEPFLVKEALRVDDVVDFPVRSI
jgi:bacillithiol biosynthesis deacetylase BshB1